MPCWWWWQPPLFSSFVDEQIKFKVKCNLSFAWFDATNTVVCSVHYQRCDDILKWRFVCELVTIWPFQHDSSNSSSISNKNIFFYALSETKQALFTHCIEILNMESSWNTIVPVLISLSNMIRLVFSFCSLFNRLVALVCVKCNIYFNHTCQFLTIISTKMR